VDRTRKGDAARPVARSPRTVASVIALTAAGFALRLISLDSRSLWLDEAITVRQAGRPLIEVIRTLAAGVHPPLYHVIMHFWMSAFGQSEVALRGFSVLVGVIAIPVAWWAGTRLYDRRSGIAAAALLAFSPFQIWYSQEARMYELLFLAGLLSVTFLALALRGNRARHWLGYLLFTTVGLFTHYFFLFLMVGEVGYYMFGHLPACERRLRRAGLAKARWSRPWRLFADVPTLGPWLASSALMATLMGVWVANSILVPVGGENALLQSLGGGGLGYGQEGAVLALRFNDIAQVIVGMTVGFHAPLAMEVLAATWPLLIYSMFLIFQVMGPATQHTRLLLVAGSGLFILVLLGQWQGQVLTARYFMAVAAPLYLLGGRLIARLERRMAAPFIAALLVVSLVAWADQSYNPGNSMTFDNRQAIGRIAAGWKPGDLVIYMPFYLDPLTDYYVPKPIPVYGFPRYGAFGQLRNTQGEIDEDMLHFVGSSRRVWLLLSFQNLSQLRTDAEAVRYWLKHNGFTVRLDASLNQVEVLRYDASVSARPPAFFLPGASGETSGAAAPGTPSPVGGQ
jgi:mannosyltransferase